MIKFLVVSCNCKKLVELCWVLDGVGLLGLMLLLLGDVLLLFEILEIGVIFEDNVLVKVCDVFFVIGFVSVVDDFGLEVVVLGGMFGVLLVWWFGRYGDDVVNIVLLLV